jgi:hypothetical protein
VRKTSDFFLMGDSTEHQEDHQHFEDTFALSHCANPKVNSNNGIYQEISKLVIIKEYQKHDDKGRKRGRNRQKDS